MTPLRVATARRAATLLALAMLTAGGAAAAVAAAAEVPGAAASGAAVPGTAAFGTRSGYSLAGLYDAGNAYARAGRLGMAILYYQRAQLLAPGDDDVEANLRAVRAAAGLPAATGSAASRALGNLDPMLVSGMAGLGLVLMALAAAAIPALRPHRLVRLAGGGLGAALVALVLANAVLVWPRLHAAVVIARSAPVRAAPAPMSGPVFTLREGESVRLRAEYEGFALVQTGAGRSGWAWHADLAAVAPR